MRTTLAVLALLLCSGCVMTRYRQQGLEIGLDGAVKARDEIVTAADAVRDVVAEVGRAVNEDRPPDVSAPAAKAAAALEAAHAHVEDVGETLAVMQKDLGRSPVPPPMTAAEREMWRARYVAASKLYKMAASWIKGALGSALGRRISAPAGPEPAGWSPGGIAAVIAAITAAAGALGETTRRGVKRSREKRAGHAAELSEALDALDEVKVKHPDAVKEATNAERRPHLRVAFVRRESDV